MKTVFFIKLNDHQATFQLNPRHKSLNVNNNGGYKTYKRVRFWMLKI